MSGKCGAVLELPGGYIPTCQEPKGHDTTHRDPEFGLTWGWDDEMLEDES